MRERFAITTDTISLKCGKNLFAKHTLTLYVEMGGDSDYREIRIIIKLKSSKAKKIKRMIRRVVRFAINSYPTLLRSVRFLVYNPAIIMQIEHYTNTRLNTRTQQNKNIHI